MADNQYVNKVEYAGQTLVDLTGDTVEPSDVLSGVSFHSRSGAPQQGNLITHNVYDGLDSTSASDALSAKQGKVINDKFKGNGSAQVRNISTVYFTERSAFTAWRSGRLLTFRGYFNVTTQIPESTVFAQHGILSAPGNFCMVNVGTNLSYIIQTSGDGKLQASGTIPTGYYYIVGSIWIDG